MPKTKETVLEINLEALAHNYAYLKAKRHANTKFVAVTKAFAYGSDACAIAKKIESLGVDYLAVAYTNEGIALRNAGITARIIVLHPQSVNFKDIITYALEPNLYTINVLKEFINTVNATNKQQYPVHIKFNTGLNRLGFTAENIPKIAALTKSNSTIKIASIFSHLAASEDLNEKEFTEKQIVDFTKIIAQMKASLSTSFETHLVNTSGLLNYPQAHFSMVRSGIGLYGYSNNPQIDKKLIPVATLKTVISQIHYLESGQSVGYNMGYTSASKIKTATLPIGHADGIGRQYGKGNNHVTVNGSKATIIGNVCMDMIMIDVTHIDCKEGDEVILFGPDQSAEEFANDAGTISYELLTSISLRVKRVILP